MIKVTVSIMLTLTSLLANMCSHNGYGTETRLLPKFLRSE